MSLGIKHFNNPNLLVLCSEKGTLSFLLKLNNLIPSMKKQVDTLQDSLQKQSSTRHKCHCPESPEKTRNVTAGRDWGDTTAYVQNGILEEKTTLVGKQGTGDKVCI